VNWLKKWLKPSAPANSDAMNWAEQWLNRSQWFKDKYLKERYLVAEAVLHALSDPSPRVDLPLPYADMDEFIRALLDLGKIAGKNLFHPQQPNATPIWRTWLNLSHPDGRIREQTLHTLPARIPGTLYAILVLLRLNDWAAPVRAAARHRLADFAAATAPQHLAAALGYILRYWTSWGRMSPASKQDALSVLLSDAVAAQLATALARSPAGPMTTLLAQLGQVATIDRHLPHIAAHAIQPALRAKVYQSLLSGKTTWVAGKEQEWIERRHNLHLRGIDHEQQHRVELVGKTIRRCRDRFRTGSLQNVARLRRQIHAIRIKTGAHTGLRRPHTHRTQTDYRNCIRHDEPLVM